MHAPKLPRAGGRGHVILFVRNTVPLIVYKIISICVKRVQQTTQKTLKTLTKKEATIMLCCSFFITTPDDTTFSWQFNSRTLFLLLPSHPSIYHNTKVVCSRQPPIPKTSCSPPCPLILRAGNQVFSKMKIYHTTLPAPSPAPRAICTYISVLKATCLYNTAARCFGQDEYFLGNESTRAQFNVDIFDFLTMLSTWGVGESSQVLICLPTNGEAHSTPK